jgi:hypothetical protein
MTSYVYALTDPRTNEIRYVGGTTKTLNSRLRNHIRYASSGGGNDHKSCWIKSLLNDCVKPEIHLLEEVDGHFADAEREWISCFRHMKMRLTNLTEGGQGMWGYKREHSEETRQKISVGNKGKILSPETKAKMSAVRKGRVFTEEHKANMRIAQKGRQGTPCSESRREGVRQFFTGRKQSPEHLAARMLSAQKNRLRNQTTV